MDHAALGLVLGVRRDGRARVRVAGVLVAVYDRARDASAASARPSWRTSAAIPPDRRDAGPVAIADAHRQTWAFALGKFLTDPVWWLYLFWVPDFLHRNHGINLSTMGPPLVVIYLIADVGSIGGGWLSSTSDQARLDGQRRPQDRDARLRAVGAADGRSRRGAKELWVAVALISVAAAAHQGWSANLFTLVSDMFPRQAVGSVVGFGGMAGAVGGMLIAKLTGYILQATGSYVPVFLIACIRVCRGARNHPDARAETGTGTTGITVPNDSRSVRGGVGVGAGGKENPCAAVARSAGERATASTSCRLSSCPRPGEPRSRAEPARRPYPTSNRCWIQRAPAVEPVEPAVEPVEPVDELGEAVEPAVEPPAADPGVEPVPAVDPVDPLPVPYAPDEDEPADSSVPRTSTREFT